MANPIETDHTLLCLCRVRCVPRLLNLNPRHSRQVRRGNRLFISLFPLKHKPSGGALLEKVTSDEKHVRPNEQQNQISDDAH